jgi:hypothetical protein
MKFCNLWSVQMLKRTETSFVFEDFHVISKTYITDNIKHVQLFIVFLYKILDIYEI